MSKLHHRHRTDDIKHDSRLVDDLLLFCNAGRLFYSEAAQRADRQTVRNLLLNMAIVRHQILIELTSAIDGVAVIPSSFEGIYPDHEAKADRQIQDAIKTILQWYNTALQELEQGHEETFIHHMLEEERTALLALREGARCLQNPFYSNLLASHIASIQIAFDQLRSLSEQYG